MSKMCKIIELYGLPGCGKTTLRNLLVDPDMVCDKTFCLQSELTNTLLKQNIFTILLGIPYKSWWYLLCIFVRFPKSKTLRVYRTLIIHTYCYYHIGLIKNYDYVVIDHGIVQSLIGILVGYKYEITSKDKMYITKLTNSIKQVVFVNCDISPELSLGRIRHRGRLHGRLDIIEDDVVLENSLRRQKRQFAQVFNAIDENESLGYRIDMEQNTEKIIRQLLSILD